MSEEISAAAPQRRTWIAKQEAYIKSELTDARELPDDKRMAVPAGATLMALRTGLHGRFLSVAEAELNGQVLPPHLTYINRGHWKVLKPGEDPAKPGRGKGMGKRKHKGKGLKKKNETPAS